MIFSIFKRKCPFDKGDMVYPSNKFKNLYYMFPKGPAKVIDIRDGRKEHGWYFIQVATKNKNWIYARALIKK